MASAMDERTCLLLVGTIVVYILKDAEDARTMRGGQTWKHCKEQSAQKQSADSAGASGCLLHWQRLKESIWVCFFGDTMIPEPSSYIILPLGLYGLESDTPGQFVLRNATWKASLLECLSWNHDPFSTSTPSAYVKQRRRWQATPSME